MTTSLIAAWIKKQGFIEKINSKPNSSQRELAKELGFTTFSAVKTSREFARPKSGSFVHVKRTKDYENAEKNEIMAEKAASQRPNTELQRKISRVGHMLSGKQVLGSDVSLS